MEQLLDRFCELQGDYNCIEGRFHCLVEEDSQAAEGPKGPFCSYSSRREMPISRCSIANSAARILLLIFGVPV